MKTRIFILLTVGFVFSINSCNSDLMDNTDGKPAQPIELTLKQVEKVSADNRFSFAMFREISALNDKPNTFFSPLSLHFALGMLYNGASGETRTEMAEVLGMSNFTDIEINEYYRKISQALLKIDPQTDITIANSIWYRSGFPVKQPFKDVNKKYFDASVQSLDFNKPDAADIINKWCSDKTKKRITEIVQKPIDSNTMIYLINALYFKSKWSLYTKFDKADTKQGDFTKADLSLMKVNLMEQKNTLPYYADDSVQCIELSYGNLAFSMVLMLGSNGMDIDRLIDFLDDSTWQNIMAKMRGQKVWLKLPRFKTECEMNLVKPLYNIGMRRIFVGGFTNISDGDLAVSVIKQKTFVEVNEEGTEAAAITAIGMEGANFNSNEQLEPVQFFADRPFLYLIKERSTGAILFIGRMDEPNE